MKFILLVCCLYVCVTEQINIAEFKGALKGELSLTKDFFVNGPVLTLDRNFKHVITMDEENKYFIKDEGRLVLENGHIVVEFTADVARKLVKRAITSSIDNLVNYIVVDEIIPKISSRAKLGSNSVELEEYAKAMYTKSSHEIIKKLETRGFKASMGKCNQYWVVSFAPMCLIIKWD